ncbi:RB1-inducible coiled-coil protein 1 isoform X2 [Zootermopsis nevadensis]|uniref:RB1-inducible coiled-coil protein 1 isoform X2 n=1 Tax=Zootermopsis nevadensis TaxID=136037 RepID=UPI000B8E269E|nr:RB1-inducible coiled-coil protein 1 isoform X2 [Zootermopsis nevadensis]
MLYIFHVDTGKMMIYEMNLALECVKQLSDVIERSCGIPADKQVLLVSGGESLDPTARVCSYSAGTDTNPIYLFSKSTIEGLTPPSVSMDFVPDVALKDQVDATHSMPDTYTTVVARVQLAQQFYEHAREQTRACENLVHDQHLQQQGWAAVLANMEDTTQSFRNRAEQFEQSFSHYLEMKAEYVQLLDNLQDDIDLLMKIPVIPALLATAEDEATGLAMGLVSDSIRTSPLQEQGEVFRSVREGVQQLDVMGREAGCSLQVQQNDGQMNLMQWVCANNQSNVYQVVQSCVKDMRTFDDQAIESLKTEVKHTLSHAFRIEMKEIKGLEERLCGLEQLMVETKKIVQEQNDLTQSFLSNQTRANVLGDASILPDLCASHRRQLLVMLKNHEHLLDIRARCTRAKEELCRNLHVRLRWVMCVENMISDVGNRLMMYHEKLKRMHRHFVIIQQIHISAQMYINAVGEVVRRRTFSQAFLVWASDLACQLLAVHNEEVARRREFQSQFEGHFMRNLFPGMEDLPPSFATQAPVPFDLDLPQITIEDIDWLHAQLPELTFSVSGPDLETITQFFLIKSVTGTLKTEDREETAALEDRLVRVVTNAGLASHLDPTLLQPADPDAPGLGQSPSPISLQGNAPPRDHDRGFESETDTEEFEKVGQSPVELVFDSKPSTSSVCISGQVTEQVQEQDRAPCVLTTLEENLGNTRSEVERLREQLSACAYVTCDMVSRLRADLAGLRAHVQQEQVEFGRLQVHLLAALGQQYEAAVASEKVLRQEQLQRLTVDHELEMDSLRKDVRTAVETNDEEIRILKQTNVMKEEELASLQARMEERLEEEVHVRQEAVQNLELKLSEMREQCSGLQGQLERAEANKQTALKDLSDQLTHSYKTELEGLRSRFRLMATTSMERSPSDGSLEKIERCELIELVNHEAIVAQIREDLATEREASVRKAVEQERARWEARLEQELKQARVRSEAERQVWFNETMRRVLDDKERQLGILRMREASLVEECQRHQQTIRLLTDSRDCGPQSGYGPDSSAGSAVWPLLDRVDVLEAHKVLQQAQMAEEHEKKAAEMNTSVAVVQQRVSSRDAATSPDPSQHRLQEKLTQSTTSLIQQGKISISSCNIGDSVLVVWDEEHRNYTILQETATLYFLHSDCLDTLGLCPGSDGSPRRLYSTGEVTDKEYCYARKSENRYRVPKGTKFYRVQVQPLQKDSSLVRSQHHHRHHHLHSQQSMTQSQQQLVCSQQEDSSAVVMADEKSKC